MGTEQGRSTTPSGPSSLRHAQAATEHVEEQNLADGAEHSEPLAPLLIPDQDISAMRSLAIGKSPVKRDLFELIPPNPPTTHPAYSRPPVTQDVLVLRTRDNVLFHVPRAVLVSLSESFANLVDLQFNASEADPLELPSASSKGLALVLEALKHYTLDTIDRKLFYDALVDALIVTDAYDIPRFQDQVRIESIRIADPLSTIAFHHFLVAAALNDERVMRQRAWDTISLGIAAVSPDVASFFRAHDPLPLDRLADLHKRYGAPWYRLRQALIGLNGEKSAFDRFGYRCDTTSYRWHGCGCVAYRKFGGDYATMRQAAALALLHTTRCELEELRRFDKPWTLLDWAKVFAQCRNCGPEIAQLFGPLIQRAIASFPPAPLGSPSWLHPGTWHAEGQDHCG